MLIRVANVIQDSIVDGPGLRLVVFTQGCPHGCEGCHNPETHSFTGGRLMNTEKIISMMDKNPLLEGITLSGGEPFCQPEACIELAKAAKQRGLTVWAYTGYLYDHILMGRSPVHRQLLSLVDVLIDGPFIEEQRTLDLPWRGSKNQRLIDVPQALAAYRKIVKEDRSCR